MISSVFLDDQAGDNHGDNSVLTYMICLRNRKVKSENRGAYNNSISLRGAKTK